MTPLKHFFKGFKKGMSDFGNVITTVVSTFLLSFVYIIGVSLTSLFTKLKGKQFLQLKQSEKESYWTELNLKRKDIKEYYKQF